MAKYLTKKQITDHLDKDSIEDLSKIAIKIGNELKKSELWASDICLIAHFLLENYSDKAKNAYKTFNDMKNMNSFEFDELMTKVSNGEFFNNN